MRGLEPKHDVVVERRDVAVLARRQAGQPGLARMHDQRVGAGRARPSRSTSSSACFGILVVDADAAFHRHRDRDRGLHRGDAIADQRRLRHQAGAEAALLHAIRRAADVEIDLVVAEVRADPRALRRAPRDRSRRVAAPPDARPDRSRSAARGRRAAPRRWSPSRCRSARGASAGDGRTGNAGRSIPSCRSRTLRTSATVRRTYGGSRWIGRAPWRHRAAAVDRVAEQVEHAAERPRRPAPSPARRFDDVHAADQAVGAAEGDAPDAAAAEVLLHLAGQVDRRRPCRSPSILRAL